jgi:hypothetical protein
MQVTPYSAHRLSRTHLSPPEGLALLNAQRAANGIPGDLIENGLLSRGCVSWATEYRPAKRQYPHTELPSQPGYTELGREAASMSDLSGTPGGPVGTGIGWTSATNTWMQAPIHESQLWNPESTAGWYGEGPSASCIGTTGTRAFPAPAFFSLPGPGTTNVPTAVTVVEEPFTPEMGVGLAGVGVGGIGSSTYLAPPILLWAPGTPGASLQGATLRTSAGVGVPIKVVTPSTPAPPSPPPFPTASTYGFYTHASFVIPTVKFRPRTTYVLTATWTRQIAPSTQTVTFSTGSTDFNGQILAAEDAILFAGAGHGTVTAKLSPKKLVVLAAGVAIGQSLQLTIEPCGRFGCFSSHPWSRVIRLTASPTRLTIPMPRSGRRALLNGSMPSFVAGGHSYRGESLSFQLSARRVSK